MKLLVTSIIGLFASRYTIETLGISDFGLYSILGGVVTMFAFVNTIMVGATYRFLAVEIGIGVKSNINKIFNICFNIHLALGFLVLVINETFGIYYVKNYLNFDTTKLNDALIVLRLSALATFFSILSIPYQGLLTAHENFLFRSIVEIIRSLLGLAVALFLFTINENRLVAFAVLIAISNVLPTIFYFFYCRVKYLDQVKLKFYKDKPKYKEVLSFTGWSILGAAGVVGQNTGTPILINSYFGTSMNGSYGIGSQVRSLISQFASNLAQAAVPQITKNYSTGNMNRSISIVSYSSKYTWFLMLFPALPLLLETNYLLALWLHDVPKYAVDFTRLLMIFTLVNGIGNGIGTIIQANGNIKTFQLVLSITNLLGLPIGYYFYYLGYGPTSIIYVFICTTLLNVFLVQIILNKLMSFDVKTFIEISYLRIIYVSLSLIPLHLFNEFFQESFLRFILTSIISVIWLMVSIYFLGLNKFERVQINKYLLLYILKIKNATFS